MYMSILKQQINSPSNFASFFLVMTKNSPVNYKLIHFLLWIKESHQSPNFETFKCSGENFLNSPCHFWKQKSVFLQILNQYSLPSNITPLSFLSWSIMYLSQNQLSKGHIFEFFECSGQNLLNSLCQFWTSQFVLKFCIVLHCHNT